MLDPRLQGEQHSGSNLAGKVAEIVSTVMKSADNNSQ